MKPQVIISICVMAVLVLACSAVTINFNPPTAVPMGSQPAPTSGSPLADVPTDALPSTVAAPTEMPPALPPTITPVPTATEVPTITPSPTPADPFLTTIDKPVNCRFGPGTEYSIIGYFLLGQTTRIEGKSGDGKWWFIRSPQNPSDFCWVAASVTSASGNLALVNLVSAPDVFVTDVSLKIEPDTIIVPGCVFPYIPVTMTGSITTNGPAMVEWHWETSQGNVSSSSMIKFAQSGTKTVSDYYKYGTADTHWIKLVVTSPNSKVVKATYKVTCGP